MDDPTFADSGIRADLADHDYWLKRADDHRQLAEKAAEAEARTIHLRLSELYRARAGTVRMVVPD